MPPVRPVLKRSVKVPRITARRERCISENVPAGSPATDLAIGATVPTIGLSMNERWPRSRSSAARAGPLSHFTTSQRPPVLVHPRARRLRSRCRDRDECRVLAVVQAASCGIGGDAFWLIWDPAEGRQHALNGSGRAPASADAAALRGRGMRVSGVPRAAVHLRAGRRAVMGRRPSTIRAAVARDHPRAGHRARFRTASQPGTACDERFQTDVPAGQPRHRAGRRLDGGLTAARPCVATGRARPPAGALGHAVPARDRRLGRLLRGRDGRPAGPRPRGGRFLDRPRRPAVAHVDVERTDLHELPRGPRVTTHRPELVGPGRARDPQHPGAVRATAGDCLRGRPRRGRLRWVHLGLEASKLAMADRDAHLTDPEFTDIPMERLVTRPRGVVGRSDRSPRGPRAPSGNRAPKRGRHDLAGRRRRRGNGRQPHRVELRGLRVWRRRSRDGHRLPEPRRVLQPR